MMFVYGTRKFIKFCGYYGQPETCLNCNRTYSKAFVKVTTWAHFDYIPLFPMGTSYLRLCPVCAAGVEINKNSAKELMVNKNETQRIYLYGKHYLKNHPAGLIHPEISYELWMRDLSTNEESCVFTHIRKDQIKNIKKSLGIKKLEIINIK